MKSETEMLGTMAKYCSLAERCINDIHKKIKTEGLSADAEKRIVDYLLKEKYIDEKRFCRSFVNDKFKFNHWGRIKICYELKSRNIPQDVYYEAIENIDEDEYISVLTDLLKSKKRTTKGRSQQDIFQKLCRFAASRGFETPIIIDTLKSILKDIDYE
jgi:Uncharacterized protein conserved in bacteria